MKWGESGITGITDKGVAHRLPGQPRIQKKVDSALHLERDIYSGLRVDGTDPNVGGEKMDPHLKDILGSVPSTLKPL